MEKWLTSKPYDPWEGLADLLPPELPRPSRMDLGGTLIPSPPAPPQVVIDLDALAEKIVARLDLDDLAGRTARRIVEMFNGGELAPDRERIGFTS